MLLKAKKYGNNKLINNRNPDFTSLLMDWNKRQNARQMPWKGERDVYKIWISEIILQQTRVEQGLDYYQRFITSFPSIHHLANANEEQVFKLWEGLGYYTRCRNLIETARYISKENDGKFPTDFEDIRALKGVGEYTASAIASFAYDLPYPVLDGNVYRVLSRYFGINLPIDNNNGKNFFSLLARQLLDENQPAQYNQAIMDFGALICKPKLPLCNECVLIKECFANKKNSVDKFPVKKRNLKRRTRWLYYYVIEYNGKVYIKKRVGKDIWQNLYEFVLLDSDVAIAGDELVKKRFLKKIIDGVTFKIQNTTKIYRQQLTHLEIKGQFIHVSISAMPKSLKQYRLVTMSELQKFAFPKFILSYLREKNVNLS